MLKKLTCTYLITTFFLGRREYQTIRVCAKGHGCTEIGLRMQKGATECTKMPDGERDCEAKSSQRSSRVEDLVNLERHFANLLELFLSNSSHIQLYMTFWLFSWSCSYIFILIIFYYIHHFMWRYVNIIISIGDGSIDIYNFCWNQINGVARVTIFQTEPHYRMQTRELQELCIVHEHVELVFVQKSDRTRTREPRTGNMQT